jgi:transposase InsO family protein
LVGPSGKETDSAYRDVVRLLRAALTWLRAAPDEARYLCPNCWRNKASKKTRRPWGMDSGGSEVGKPDALLHHSDQGSQYTSEQFQRLMADSGIVCSMSRSGNVWDNAAMESFFSSLKTERTARKIYPTRNEARADVFDYIERFYNANATSLTPIRRHSTIGYISPVEFERKAGLA